ncbi:MAG: pentapeptide repeat-containing protein [Myxococcota bacterium]
MTDLNMAWDAMSGADLSGRQLGGAELTGADLFKANLEGAVLRMAMLSECDLRGANLKGADLRGACLRNADMRDADMQGALLNEADLRGAVLNDANLQSADLSDTILNDAHLRKVDARHAIWDGATMDQTDLYFADLRGADCRFLKLERPWNTPRLQGVLLSPDTLGPSFSSEQEHSRTDRLRWTTMKGKLSDIDPLSVPIQQLINHNESEQAVELLRSMPDGRFYFWADERALSTIRDRWPVSPPPKRNRRHRLRPRDTFAFPVGPGAALNNADLERTDLYAFDLRGAHLQRANLAGAELGRADLRWADLCGANLRNSMLQRADLTEANLWGADLRGADLRETRWKGADFTATCHDNTTRWPKRFVPPTPGPPRPQPASTIWRSDPLQNRRAIEDELYKHGPADILPYIMGRMADISRPIDLRGARLSEISLTQLTDQELFLEYASLHHATLSEVTLKDGRLRGATFNESTLSRCNFEGADLAGADFYRATLTDINVQSADLQGASFEGAHLQNVDFRHADLRGADLSTAIFGTVQLQDVYWDALTRWPDDFPMNRLSEPPTTRQQIPLFESAQTAANRWSRSPETRHCPGSRE